jgi:hypothetical protein
MKSTPLPDSKEVCILAHTHANLGLPLTSRFVPIAPVAPNVLPAQDRWLLTKGARMHSCIVSPYLRQKTIAQN